MPKTPQLGAETRARIAELLPQALRSSLDSYHEFVTTGISDQKTKDFSAHHTAAKVALAHIQLLIKLAAIAGLGSKNEAAADGTDDLAMLMNLAKIELGQFSDAEIESESKEEAGGKAGDDK